MAEKAKRTNWAAIILLLIVGLLCLFLWSSVQTASRVAGTSSSFGSSPRSVRYEVTGSGVSAVSLTWENNTGGTEQGDYRVPFRQTYTMDRGDFVYISAQITEGGGSIECRIFIDGDETFYAKASSFASIATCSGSVP